ncbi:MAG: hypothetical protein IKB09_00485 [Oscillospiraceae bacterium]|nr:hypothetical protein [Oscillospiraceae bacterium]
MDRNTRNALMLSLGFLLIFLGGKVFLGNREELSLLEWLFTTNPRHHSYLFGWLAMKNRFLTCALICIMPAFCGWTRLAVSGFSGFTAGLIAGEIYHFLFYTPQLSGIPYSWVIWLGCFAGSLVVGIILQLLKKKP